MEEAKSSGRVPPHVGVCNVAAANTMTSPTEELPELCKESHWNLIYLKEYRVFVESDGRSHPEEWFETRVPAIAKWVSEHLGADELRGKSVLDLGCGNGAFLRRLNEELGTKLQYFGVDFAFGGQLLGKKLVPSGNFQKFDIRDVCEGEGGDDKLFEGRRFEAIHDKGTLDVFAMMPNATEEMQRYMASVDTLSAPGSLVFVTSCNLTDEELRRFFECKGKFRCVDSLSHPSYQFGGAIGQTVTSLAFKKSD